MNCSKVEAIDQVKELMKERERGETIDMFTDGLADTVKGSGAAAVALQGQVMKSLPLDLFSLATNFKHKLAGILLTFQLMATTLIFSKATSVILSFDS